jgi:alkaline phosphatase
MSRALFASAIGGVISLLCNSQAIAQVVPIVQGPESVADWYKPGDTFIAQSKEQHNNNRRAKNAILFIGDGMGVSTVRAARILEGQMKGKPGEENRLSSTRSRTPRCLRPIPGISRPPIPRRR